MRRRSRQRVALCNKSGLSLARAYVDDGYFVRMTGIALNYLWAFCALCLAHAAFAVEHPAVVHREFSHTEDVGFGNSVFLVGDAELLGANDPAKGIQMRYTAGNVWKANVAIEPRAGALNYQFVSRATDPSVYCDSSNTSNLSAGDTLVLGDDASAPYEGKTIYYYSAWEQVNLFYWSTSAGVFVEQAMARVGDGRSEDEGLYKIAEIGEAGRDLIFIFNNGDGLWDNAFGQSGQNYETPLDFIFVQDGHVFNYWPAAAVSAPRFETRAVASTVVGIDGRNIKIYLPRGYDSHPNRRYPVLYMHDGQNVFSPGGSFGSWDVDLTASAEIQMGRVRECIIVAIDNTEDRLSEYLPPTDDFNGTGRCDDYASFVIDNVRPTLDVNYRTLNDPSNTLLMGSSFGGIATIYMGWAHASVFGKLGVLSPSWWAIPNLRNQMHSVDARSERVFLYWGTEESSTSADAATWWPPFLDGYDIYLSQGYHVGGDFLLRVGCGLAHNEAAWANQMAEALGFLLDVNDSPNELAYVEARPAVEIAVNEGDEVNLQFTGISGYRYEFESTDDLTDSESWSLVSARVTSRYWKTFSVSDTIEAEETAGFYRVSVTLD